MSASSRQALMLQRGRRDFPRQGNQHTVLAAGALGIPRASRAAEPVNIGALYPTTGSFAQIGQGCVNAAKLAVQMVNDAGGIKSQGGVKLNLIVSDVQSDTTVTRTETSRLISGNKLSAIHGCFASATHALDCRARRWLNARKCPLLTEARGARTNSTRAAALHLHSLRPRIANLPRRSCKWPSWSANSRKSPMLFENTAFGTSTSNGLREQAAGRGRKLSCSSPTPAGLTKSTPAR